MSLRNRGHRAFAGTALSLVLGLLSASGAEGATYRVPAGDVPALQAAVTAANATAGADHIYLAPQATYVFDGSQLFTSTQGKHALPALTGAGITIHGNLATLRRSTAPGTLQFRLLVAPGSARVEFENLVVENFSNLTTSNSTSGGGVVRITSGGTAGVEFRNCTFRGNSVESDYSTPALGGVLYVPGNPVTMRRCLFEGNFVRTEDGNTSGLGARGGVYACLGAISVPLTVEDCTFQGNYAEGSLVVSSPTGLNSSVWAGALYLGDMQTVIIQRCVFRQNSAYQRGPLVTSGEGSSFGGAITTYFDSTGTGATGGTMTVEDTLFEGNYSARTGGAIQLHTGTNTFKNCTFTDNVSSSTLGPVTGSGGAIYVASPANMTLIHCTVTSNKAVVRGGGIDTATPVNLRSTVLAANLATGAGATNHDGRGSFTSGGYNVIGNGTGMTGLTYTSPSTDRSFAGMGVSTVADIFQSVEPVDNGGFSETMLPKAGGLLVDAASASVASAAGLVNDQRGPGYARSAGAAPDTGAAERGASGDSTAPVAGTAAISSADRWSGVSLQWSGFSDPETAIKHYEIALGTAPGLSDLLPWIDAGTAASGLLHGATLSTGSTVHASVRAVNGAGLRSAPVSASSTVLPVALSGFGVE